MISRIPLPFLSVPMGGKSTHPHRATLAIVAYIPCIGTPECNGYCLREMCSRHIVAQAEVFYAHSHKAGVFLTGIDVGDYRTLEIQVVNNLVTIEESEAYE